MVDYLTVADQALRLGGPYDPQTVVRAAAVVAELVRRLNHATAPAEALPSPASVYELVGGLRAATAGMQQLLRQLATRIDAWTGDPARVPLRHAQHRAPRQSQDMALLDALYAGADLRRAGQAATQLAEHLGQAHHRLAHLQLTPPGQPS